jgi:pimeloyl-ACP methyl ester carboxylesterase
VSREALSPARAIEPRSGERREVEDGGEVRASEAPEERRARGNGVELAYFEWRRELRGREATILLAHATGFHARVWDQMIRHLGERHVIAVDQRGHGRSEGSLIRHWHVLGEDLTALARELDLRDAIGVGHSMGGHALTEAAAARPESFRRLVLIDPVIAAPAEYRGGGWMTEQLGGEVHPTAKRKDDFASPDEMFERLGNRAPYSGFDPSVLRDYCEHGLVPAPDGNGYVLACRPEIEASVYMTSRTNAAVYESIRAIEIPVTILRARGRASNRDLMDFASSPTWPGLVHEFQDGREVYLADHTHFLPMEAPELVAGYVLSEVGT